MECEINTFCIEKLKTSGKLSKQISVKNDTVNNSDVKNELEKIILFFKDGSFKMYKN